VSYAICDIIICCCTGTRTVLPLQQGKQNALRDIYHNYFHVLLCRERHNLILCHAEVLYEATWPVHNYVCVCVSVCECVLNKTECCSVTCRIRISL